MCVYKAAYVCAWMGLVVQVCNFANDDFRVLDCVRVANLSAYNNIKLCVHCVCEANTIT